MADHQKIISLNSNELGPVTAGIVKHDADINILNPELHIATLGDRGKVEMEMVVQKGRDYVSAERNVQKDLGIGYIPLDSVHSPVVKAKYHVEPARVGQKSIQYKKLTSIEELELGVCAYNCLKDANIYTLKDLV